MKNFLSVCLGFLLLSCNSKKESIHPFRKDIVQAVYASGKVYPVNVYNVYPKLPGYISKIFVKAGELVNAGQTLMSIQSEVSEKNLEIAKNQLKLASINVSEQSPLLNALKEEIKSAHSKYRLDSSNYYRYLNLFKNNATSELQYEQAKTQFEISRQNYFKSLQNFEQTKNQLKVEYENAKLLYEAQQSNLSDYKIVSTINGKVYDIIPKEGELAGNQTLLMVIGNNNLFEVELYIDETDIQLVKPGQNIVYEIDAFPNKFFSGKVKSIYPRINPVNKTCRLLATIENDGVQFYSGMSVEANIVISEKKQALVIPKNYLLNRQYVITLNYDTIKVKTGIEDIEYVEIKEGIDEKTELIKP